MNTIEQPEICVLGKTFFGRSWQTIVTQASGLSVNSHTIHKMTKNIHPVSPHVQNSMRNALEKKIAELQSTLAQLDAQPFILKKAADSCVVFGELGVTNQSPQYIENQYEYVVHGYYFSSDKPTDFVNAVIVEAYMDSLNLSKDRLKSLANRGFYTSKDYFIHIIKKYFYFD